MKNAVLLAAALIAGSSSAFAQTSTPAPSQMPSQMPSQSPMPGSPTSPTSPVAPSQPPVPGANSFTEAQARSWIEKVGYTDVGGLVKSEDGVWRGQARKNGATVTVAVDYKGTVTTR